MSTLKALKHAQQNAVRQQAVLDELDALVKSIDRSEKMIRELKAEVASVNIQHQSRATTREDIAYLEDLLRCAKTKLVWEKQMTALQRRIPVILGEVSALMNDSVNAPGNAVREAMTHSLQAVQAAMQRLEHAKIDDQKESGPAGENPQLGREIERGAD